MTSIGPEVEAIEKIAARKFHRIFTAPATDKHGPLKFTYCIAGIEGGDNVPTILFCGGMFGTRWQGILLNHLAEKEGVRVIFTDRFGFGGSTPVAISERIPTFLEVIPLLLKHLNVKHIALACQSCGTIYALNLLSQYPDLLSPTNPSVTFFSPWVHQSLSSVSFLKLASVLPNGFLDHWNKITGFMINNASPAFTVSGGAITAVTSAFKSKAVSENEKREEAERTLEQYGMSLQLKEEIEKCVFKYAFAEDTTGANDEARLCLKSVNGTSWGVCDDYEKCVQALAEVWETRVEEGKTRLRVDIVLPEEDIMVGDKGMLYFENCWRKENTKTGMFVECVRIPKSDHDTTPDAGKGAIGKLFTQVKWS